MKQHVYSRLMAAMALGAGRSALAAPAHRLPPPRLTMPSIAMPSSATARTQETGLHLGAPVGTLISISASSEKK